MEHEEGTDPVLGPEPATEQPEVNSQTDEESDQSRSAVSDPTEPRTLDGKSSMLDDDEDENDENYEPNQEESDSEQSAETSRKGCTHVWKVENFSGKLEGDQEKYYSEKFKSGDFDCRVLLFPRGNLQGVPLANSDHHISIYVEVLGLPPQGVYGTFGFTVVDKKDDEKSVRKEGNHKFTIGEYDRGFKKLISLADVRSKERGFLVDDTLEIRTVIRVQTTEDIRMLESRPLYDSKEHTGFVGLKNQGATCYMNSLLQFMYHIPRLREAVYNMPTEETKKEGIALALQRVFYHLQTNSKSVDTKALTKSFGWNSMEAFMQHDVQEFSRVLCDSLEEKMKGTKVDGMIAQLFKGKLENFIECINVDYKSTKYETFYDLPLVVKGCANLHESFKQYMEVETLEGDNQYRAEGHGKQDAKKGCRFLSFPPVMHLHLKRFEYDAMQNLMVKVNDAFEFPTQIDVSEFLHEEGEQRSDPQKIKKDEIDVPNGSQKAENAEKLSTTQNMNTEEQEATKIPKVESGLQQAIKVPRVGDNLYLLHSVLVHSGSVHGGHYFAYIRPCPRLVTDAEPSIDENGREVYPDAGKWYRFDDEEVRRVPQTMAVSKNFGGAEDFSNFNRRPLTHRRERPRASSAYMLVYINYKETLYHPRLQDLVAKTAEKIREEKKRQDLLEKHQENDREPGKGDDAIQTPRGPLENDKENSVHEVQPNYPKEQKVLEMKQGQRILISRDRGVTKVRDEHTEQKGNVVDSEESKEVKVPGNGLEMEVEIEEKELTDNKYSEPRPGEKRKRKHAGPEQIRRRRRKKHGQQYPATESADDTNEGADIPVPGHLLTRFQHEEEERKKREEELQRAHLYHDVVILAETKLMKVKKLETEFFTFQDFNCLRYPYDKKNEMPSLEDPSESEQQSYVAPGPSQKQKLAVFRFKMLKEDTLEQVKDKLADLCGIPANELQFWIFSDRENHTQRPNRMIEISRIKSTKSSEIVDTNPQQRRYGYDSNYQQKYLELFIRRRRPTDVPIGDEEAMHDVQNRSLSNDKLKAQNPSSIPGNQQRQGEEGAENAQDIRNVQLGERTPPSSQVAAMRAPEGKLLLFKYFDIEEQSLRYVGSGIFPEISSFESLYPTLRSMAGLPKDTALKLYEEENVRGGQINFCDRDTDLKTFKLLSGDIICFQKLVLESKQKETSNETRQQQHQVDQSGVDSKSPQQESKSVIDPNSKISGRSDDADAGEEKAIGNYAQQSSEIKVQYFPSRYSDVKDYLTYLSRRVKVRFKPKDEPNNTKRWFDLELSRQNSIVNLRMHVGKYLGCHHNYIRVNPHYSQPQNFHRENRDLLSDHSEILYEKLSYSVLALRKNLVFKVPWLRHDLKQDIIEVLVPKEGNIEDLQNKVIDEVKKQFPQDLAKIADEKHTDISQHIRMSCISRGVIRGIPSLDDEVAKYEQYSNDTEHLRVEMIEAAGYLNVPVFMYHMNSYNSPVTDEAGYVPFFFNIKQGEAFKTVKERLAEKVKSKRFGSFKVVRVHRPMVNNSKADEVEDDAIASDMEWTNFHIGLEFVHKPRSYPSLYDRPMKISAT